MQINYFLALSGLSVLAVAAPAATTAPPQITAAPLDRRQYDPSASYCSFASSTDYYFHSTTSACACSGGMMNPIQTVIKNTPMIVCGTSTSRDPMPMEFSAQPLVSAPAQVAFGDFDPTGLVSAISASCSNGCGGATTTLTTAISVASASVVQGSFQTSLAIEYIVTTNVMPSSEYSAFIQGLEAMISGSSTNETFTYSETVVNPVTGGSIQGPSQTQTNYYAPGHIQFSRFTMDSTGAYTDVAGVFGVEITSEKVTTDNSALCNEIEGPIAAVLGAIPDFGTAFGILGSVLCDVFAPS